LPQRLQENTGMILERAFDIDKVSLNKATENCSVRILRRDIFTKQRSVVNLAFLALMFRIREFAG
jgi:hypothetical protein